MTFDQTTALVVTRSPLLVRLMSIRLISISSDTTWVEVCHPLETWNKMTMEQRVLETFITV